MSGGAGPPEVALRAGELGAWGEPRRVTTVVGSCVAVCIADPTRGVGGVNHYLLPTRPAGRRPDPGRYGDEAIPLLVERVLALGARRRSLEAKLVGGAVLPAMAGELARIPRENLRVARDFLAAAGVRVVAREVGGTAGRCLTFDTGTGDLRVEAESGPTRQA